MTTLHVDLRAQRGEFGLEAHFAAPAPGITALFGRSGGGKSTLIAAIAGLLRPASGRIALDGEALFDSTHGVDVAPERRGIGCVFQDARLFPHLRVLGNLRYGARRARGRATRIAEADVVDLLDLGALLHRRPHELSGGERQRVALGRALLSQPRLLMLDEPLASVDLSRRQEVLPYLEALRDNVAVPVIYVSHQFDEVLRLASQLVLVDGGRTVAAGEIGSLAAHPSLRAIVGVDAFGAIIDAVVVGRDLPGGLTQLRAGDARLNVGGLDLPTGTVVRVQLLARDLILARSVVEGISVRTQLPGRVVAITREGRDAHLVEVDIGGPRVFSWVTPSASNSLGLSPGAAVHVLVKAMSIRGHVWVGLRQGVATSRRATGD